MLTKVFKVLLAIVLGFCHVLFADTLFFYGTVINPELSHQFLNIIAFLMLLPVSTLLIIPTNQTFFPITQGLILTFWIGAYYCLITRPINLYKKRTGDKSKLFCL